MWRATSAAQERWHETLAARMTHEMGCEPCGFSMEPKCSEGQRLADIEQAAHQAWVVERWGAAA